MKLVVHDGFGVWCATRRLNQGRFVWPSDGAALQQPTLSRAQFDALVVGLPWQRLAHMQSITRVCAPAKRQSACDNAQKGELRTRIRAKSSLNASAISCRRLMHFVERRRGGYADHP
jgi:hypothetical protein